MDLHISVFLLFVLFTAGHSLSCYECGDTFGSCADQREKSCPSELSKCFSITGVTHIGMASTKTKVKDCVDDCASGTFNFGLSKMSSVCCSSDRCNVQDAPDPGPGTPNGNKCYYCDEKSCFNVVSCSGNEDQCIKATVTVGRHSAVVKGCASKSVCKPKSIPIAQDISCCSGNLCNAAKSITVSFPFLCFPLLSFILMH